MPSQKLHLAPLGGLGEFGMNCMAVRWGDDIIVIDAGLMFPESELLGVDIVVPDITYLLEHREKVRGIVLTHGHEDHIGGLPWILSELQVPVFGTEFTLALVENKLDEHELLEDADLREIRAGTRFNIGPFIINPIQVTHSLVDCVALAIHTPIGILIHSGDFKVDQTPIDGEQFDFHRFAELGTRGVLALFADSTNIDRKGYSGSELEVVDAFEEIFTATHGKIVVTTFATSIFRMQIVVDLAAQFDRKVAFVGRGAIENSQIAQGLGCLTIPHGVQIRDSDVRNYPGSDVVCIATGSQGEPQ